MFYSLNGQDRECLRSIKVMKNYIFILKSGATKSKIRISGSGKSGRKIPLESARNESEESSGIGKWSIGPFCNLIIWFDPGSSGSDNFQFNVDNRYSASIWSSWSSSTSCDKDKTVKAPKLFLPVIWIKDKSKSPLGWPVKVDSKIIKIERSKLNYKCINL